MTGSMSITRRTNLKLGLALLASAALPGMSRAQSAFDLKIVQGADVDTLDPAVSRSTPSQIVFNNIFNTLAGPLACDKAELAIFSK